MHTQCLLSQQTVNLVIRLYNDDDDDDDDTLNLLNTVSTTLAV